MLSFDSLAEEWFTTSNQSSYNYILPNQIPSCSTFPCGFRKLRENYLCTAFPENDNNGHVATQTIKMVSASVSSVKQTECECFLAGYLMATTETDCGHIQRLE